MSVSARDGIAVNVQETVELVADEIAQFMAHSQQTNQSTRHLSTALDGFAVALSKLGKCIWKLPVHCTQSSHPYHNFV